MVAVGPQAEEAAAAEAADLTGVNGRGKEETLIATADDALCTLLSERLVSPDHTRHENHSLYVQPSVVAPLCQS